MRNYRSPLEEDEEFKNKEDLGKCPKCVRVGCTCYPETCTCEPQIQKDLIQSFEE